jgi:dihydrofolate reductase
MPVRKIVSLMHVSLDGFVADLKAPPPGLDWMAYTPELEKYAHAFHERADVAIHGRVTYRLMESYWPTVLEKPSAKPSTLKHARWLQQALKVVVSRTMKSTEWENSLLIKDNLPEAFARLKQQPGKDMMIFGSPGLVKSLTKLDLIDEYHLLMQPTILGSGLPLFGELDHRVRLRLVENTTLGENIAALHYERVTK